MQLHRRRLDERVVDGEGRAEQTGRAVQVEPAEQVHPCGRSAAGPVERVVRAGLLRDLREAGQVGRVAAPRLPHARGAGPAAGGARLPGPPGSRAQDVADRAATERPVDVRAARLVAGCRDERGRTGGVTPGDPRGVEDRVGARLAPELAAPGRRADLAARDLAEEGDEVALVVLGGDAEAAEVADMGSRRPVFAARRSLGVGPSSLAPSSSHPTSSSSDASRCAMHCSSSPAEHRSSAASTERQTSRSSGDSGSSAQLANSGSRSGAALMSTAAAAITRDDAGRSVLRGNIGTEPYGPPDSGTSAIF